ncbi:MAG: IclR family transcriptional regulator [Phycisphaeraceae bacterium]|nr:IclR family transcriptional regulator [Phycisphaeraceae bacterium]
MSTEFPFKTYHVPIVVRTLRVLEFLAQQPQGCGATEVSSALEIPKNTAFRILTTLADHGYLNRDNEGKTYQLERKLLNLGYAAMGETSLVEKSIDVMRDLRDLTGQTAFLAIRLEHNGVVIEQVPGLHPVKVMLQIGHRFPMHTSAPGKALLAFMPEIEQEAIVQALDYTIFTDRTISDAKAMQQELASVKQLGYALDQAEEVEGLHCVGAPILNHRGHAIAAIWVGGLAAILPETEFERLGAQVQEASLRISQRFGYEPLSMPSNASQTVSQASSN